MKTERTVNRAIHALLALLLAAGPLAAGLSAQAVKPGLSRSMEQAIRLYHEGQDTEAMDRFMDILVKGSPSEKALANEYITKITLRMNTGVNTVQDRGAEPTTLAEISQPRTAPSPRAQAPVGVSLPQTSAREEAEEAAAAQDDAQLQRERVSSRISDKIAQMRRDILLEIGKGEAIKLYMGPDGLPKALTLDPAHFFATGAGMETTFRPGSDRNLSLLAGLLFTLGRSCAMLLPEGSAEGDVKIRSIRRAIALNSYFESRGISKSRLEVNLTGTEVRFPKELTNISGLIMLFDYEKQPRLKDLEDLQTKGPKVSLGIYPTAIAVHNNEGAIVEFSAFESPIGQPTWKFQIFEVQKDGSRLLLQEMSGSGPQYNQSFWNGRKKFFGAPYPTGKYMFTVTAADTEGRETSLSRLLVIRPTPEEEKALQANRAQRPAADETQVTKTGLKTRALSPKGAKGAVTGKTLKPAGKKARAPKKAPPKKTSRKKAPVVEPADAPPAEAQAGDLSAAGGQQAPAGGLAGQFSYKIYFTEENTITAASEKRFTQVAQTINYYPMATVMLTGHANTGEAEADAMAAKRVNMVANRLSEKYRIDRSRMDINSQVTETAKPMVEIMLSGKE